MFIDERVVKTFISGLFRNRKRVYMLFATHKEVSGYRGGVVPTQKQDLTIQIRDSSFQLDAIARRRPVYPAQRVESASYATIGSAGDPATAELESLLANVADGVLFVVVIYVGLAAFKEGVDLGRAFKSNYPDAKVILTTCDCGLQMKQTELDPLLDNQTFEAVVVTSRCGAAGLMGQMITDSIELFPDHSVAMATT